MESSQPSRSYLPRVERGCCCTLKVCCMVQGIMVLVSCVINVIASFLLLLAAIGCYELEKKGGRCEVSSEDQFSVKMSIAMIVVNLAYSIICLIATSLFVHAILKREPGKILPYIWMMCIGMVGGVISLIIDAAMISPIYLAGAIFLALPLYMVICANSLRHQMQEGSKTGQNFNSLNAMQSTTNAD